MNTEQKPQVDELTDVATDVLGAWVSDQGRCVWEFTIAKAPEWTGDPGTDRETAARMCAGCPLRAECLELEQRISGAGADTVADALHPADRVVLGQMWSARCRADIEAMPADGGEQA